MTKFKTKHKAFALTKMRAAALIIAALLTLALLFTGCKQSAGGSGSGIGGTVHEAPFVEGGASLILSPDKLDITVEVTTSDGTPVTVEGCTETTIPSGTETVLHAKGTKVILKGKIIELKCVGNQLTALNVQGCTALQGLMCTINQLTALNVQGLTALQGLFCWGNKLTALNVQGCTALQTLMCGYNQLTELNVQGLNALKHLDCWSNQLTELNVQGCTALNRLECCGNQLTELNVQGLTALQYLECHGNQLTELNVQGCTALQSLNCGINKLTSLNVQGLSALKDLYCDGNQLTADAFKKLFDDLPQRVDGDNARCILYTEQTGVIEGNHTDFSTLSDLAAAFNNAKTVKKWKMYKRNINGHGEEI